MRIVSLMIVVLLTSACRQDVEITGLWELQKVDVDMIPKGFKPTYIKFENDGSFSVSKQDGDLVGLYKVEQALLSMTSSDDQWFNRQWKVFTKADELVLNDVRNSYRGAQMRFRKVERFPSFEEFLDQIGGTWELYKIKEEGKERRVTETFITIEDGTYEIAEAGQVIEEGKISIDTRHHKITFENMEITWNIRFVWDDLRLENEEMGITYRLRKE